MGEGPTWWLMATPRVMALVLRSLEPSSLSMSYSLQLMPREMPETPMSLYWLLSQLGLRFSWFTWPPSPSQELASILHVALALPLSTTKITLGMISGYSGSDHSLELHWPPCTIKLSSEPSHSRVETN
nr:hypothetical protein CUMW_042000 [Ipomoea batatas]GMD36451.1 hypothetical protein CUMW_042000 [Ipomoea batatas]